MKEKLNATIMILQNFGNSWCLRAPNESTETEIPHIVTKGTPRDATKDADNGG